MGSSPSSVTTGKKIGVKMSTAGVMSMKVPTTSRIRLISSKMTTVLSVSPSSPSLICCGMCSYDSTHDIAMEVPMSSITMAVVRTVSSRMSGRSFTEISRYTKARTSA